LINTLEWLKGKTVFIRYAFVEFSTFEGKEKAKAMNNTLFKGRPIRVEDKCRNIPDYYGRKSKLFIIEVKSNRRPVYNNELMGRSSDRYGPIKGRYNAERNFKPY
jgi:RNA recognition motif-containing protein